jgi:predicted metalloprotease with PDZ domain
MKSILSLCAFCLSMAALCQEPVKYSISIDPDDWRKAEVKVEFTPASDTLYMLAGGTQDIEGGRSAFVKNITALSGKGKEVQITKLPNAQWLLGKRKGETVIATYQMNLDHEKYNWSGGLDGTAYATDWGIFYACRTLLVFPTGNLENTEIKFEMPEDWKVTTPWQEIGLNSYKARTQSDLQSGMFFAGIHEELSFKKEEFELAFALGGPGVIAEKDMYKRLAGGVMEYYIELMGGLPNPSPDNPFNKAVVILNEHENTDGEVLGNNISILVSKEADPMSKMIGKFIFAHEFFHLWNGKSMAPENAVECEWFKEGFTNYYTLKALYQVGELDQQSFFGLIDQFFYQRYINDPAAGEESITRGDLKHNHWGLIYVGGMLAGISQDLIIRAETNNEKCLDDAMRALFQKYGGTDEGYSIVELQQLLTEVSGADQSDFFEKYVVGSQQIPIEDYFQGVGLDASRTEGHLLISVPDNQTNLQKQMLKDILGAN